MIHVCRAGRGCALRCHKVMKSQSKELKKFAGAARTTHTHTYISPALPLVSSRHVRLNAWQRVWDLGREIEGMFVMFVWEGGRK